MELTLSGEPKNKWEKRLKIVLVWVPTYFVGMSLDDFSFSSVSFSSEVGTVLNFFAYFFVSRQKSKWGLGQSPVINYMKIKNINVFTIFLSCTKINFWKISGITMKNLPEKIVYLNFYKDTDFSWLMQKGGEGKLVKNRSRISVKLTIIFFICKRLQRFFWIFLLFCLQSQVIYF